MSPIGFAPALAALQSSPFGASGGAFLFQIVAIFAIFYFLLIRPQQQQKKKHEEALGALKRGDRVVTFGGIIGEVVHVKETNRAGAAAGDTVVRTPMEDEITIRSAESRLIVERGRIARIVGPTGATKE